MSSLGTGSFPAAMKSWKVGQRTAAMMCRPRNFRAWARVLICILIVSMIQPSLVLCFDPHGGDVLTCGPHNPRSGSASGASLFSDPLDQTCHSCADVPSSMTDIGGRSSSTDPIGMVNGTSHTAKFASLSRLLFTHSYSTCPSVPHRDNSLSESAHRNDSSRSTTTRTTVLLI